MNTGFPDSKACSVLLHHGVSLKPLTNNNPKPETSQKQADPERLSKRPAVSPPVVHLSITGCILPWTPAVPPEGGQRAHGAPQDGAAGGHFRDAVHLLLVRLAWASGFTRSLSTLGSHPSAVEAIETLLISGPVQVRNLGEGHVTAVRRMSIQRSCVIGRRTGSSDITDRLLFLGL